MTTLTSREFNQDVGKAKRLARLEPVFVTDRGKPSHVLLSFDAFRQLTGQTESLADLLAMPDSTTESELNLGSGWETREERF